MQRRSTGTKAVLALALGFLLVAPAGATSLLPRTVVELIGLSEFILAGDVVSVTDGFDARGVPYTEIKLSVDEAIRGSVGKEYTFRQFGLLEPREMADGRTYLGISPDGWPKFRQGESVLVFLYRAAEQTGLRTTVGLFQGKFTAGADGYVTEAGNAGLFHRVTVEPGLLNDAEAKMLAAPGGVDPATFRGFVRKAVEWSWIEQGRLVHAR